MNGLLAGGIAVTVGGLGGYIFGIVRPYPGRELSVTAVMIGLTLIAIHRVEPEADP